jgi:hypothetical protein
MTFKTFRVGYFVNFDDKVSGWLGLSVKTLKRRGTERSAREHGQRIVSFHDFSSLWMYDLRH